MSADGAAAAAEDEFAGLPSEEEDFIEGEAGEGSGDGSDKDSSDEEEDGENEYEADGFVVDEADGEGDGEGDGSASDEAVPKAKKKKRRRNFALDEEDYELLEDNQVRVKRPQERKRLKRQGEDVAPGKEKASGAKQLQEALFGTGDLEDELEELGDGQGAAGGEGGEGGRSGEPRNRYDDFGEDISDEMDDFIVDGEDGDRRRARRRRDARVAQAAGLSTAAVQAANRLFGNFGELLDLHQSHRMFDRPDGGGLDEEGDEEDEHEEEGLGHDEEDEAERRRLERQEKAAARRQQKLLAQVDPELVDSHFLRPADQTIRQTDIPERLQLLGRSVLESVPQEQRRAVLDEAAEWVTDHLFGPHSQNSKVREVVEDGVLEVTGEFNARSYGLPAPAGQEHLWPPWMLEDVDSFLQGLDLRNNRALLVRRGKRYVDFRNCSDDQRKVEERRILDRWRNNAEEQAKLRTSVRTVLEHVFEKHEEVPLQALYRKEGCGELLSMRETDSPETTGNERNTQSEPDVRWPKGTIQPKHRRIRRWDVMWAVYNWGVRFMELYRRKHKRLDSYNRVYERAVNDEEQDAIASCHRMLEGKMATAHAMDDIDAKFRRIQEVAAAFGELNIENGEGAGAGSTKRPGRPNPLRRYLKLGLGTAAREVSLSMDAFAENVKQRELVNMPEDPADPPQEWAQQQITAAGFDDEEERLKFGDLANPDGYLKAIKEILAGELAAEPCLRQMVRNELYQHAVLTTKPTPAGEDALDPFHPCGITKHLTDKQVASLENTDTWLRILTAEKSGLITYEIQWPERDLGASLSDVGELFVSDNVANVAADWNNWRKEVLDAAVRDRLMPAMLSELRARLTANAIETVLTLVTDKFWHFVSQPPVRIMEVPDEQDQEPVQMEAPRFMAVVWGGGMQGEEPTTIVQLDGNGNLKDLLTAAQLSGNVPRTVNSGTRENPVFDPAADPKKSRDSHKLREKILEHKPNAILVATASPQSKQLKDDMEKISQYTESDARFKDELLPHLENKRVEVMWADDQVAGLWANSEAAKAEFPDYSYLVRKAVGLGRLALDPLAIIAVLLGRRKEVLSLRLHELQDKLPQEALATRLEQSLITAVAQVGVDINAMAANTWRQAPLQFVPGLGPRKARTLLASIAANDNHIKTRVDLLKQDADTPFGSAAATDVQQMGTNVFRNAAPFLRVRRGEVAALQNEEEFDALDDARIHPENEALLQVILEEAFPDLVEAGSTVDMRTAIEAPSNLQQLDLWSVADANNHLFKLPTLVDMLHELLAPYGELRLQPGVPDDEQAFYLRHGETKESLKDGKLVEAKVIWVGETEVKVVIQNNNMEAIIPQQYVSSSSTMPQLNQLFKPGQVVTARIRDTGDQQEQYYDENQRRRYTVTLTTASAALKDFDTWERRYCVSFDKAYKPPDREAQHAAQQAAQAAQQGRSSRLMLQRRLIEHPMWRAARGAEVAAELRDAHAGTALFRPAHKPTIAEQLRMINLSMKLADLATGPLIQHIEVLEDPKKPPRMAQLKPPLRIEIAGRKETLNPKNPQDKDKYEQYEDLDEIIARYVEPLVEKVTEVTNHRKCIDGDDTSVTHRLRSQLAALPGNSSAGVYCVSLNGKIPGTGCIAFGSGGAASNIYREFFSITPNGYFFRGRVYPTVEHVISAFKSKPNYKKEVAANVRTQAGAGQMMGAMQIPNVPGGGGYYPQQQQQAPMLQQQQQMGGGYGAPGGGYMPGPGYGAPAAAAAAAAGGYRPAMPAPGGYGQPQQMGGFGAPAGAMPVYGGPAGYQPAAGGPGGPYPQQGGYQQGGYQQAGGYYPPR